MRQVQLHIFSFMDWASWGREPGGSGKPPLNGSYNQRRSLCAPTDLQFVPCTTQNARHLALPSAYKCKQSNHGYAYGGDDRYLYHFTSMQGA